MQSEKTIDQSLNLSLLTPEYSETSQATRDPTSKSGMSSTASTSSLNNYRCSPNKETSQSSSSSSSISHSKSPGNVRKEPHLFPMPIKPKRPPQKVYFISPTRALLDYFEILTEYEHNEICFYEEIYFVGSDCEKNRGSFDDEDGYYKTIIGDHLEYRYEVKEFLGAGTFGQVYRCYDYKRHIEVAVKIIRNKALYRKAGDLENKILHELAKADPNDVNCIVKKHRSFEFRGHLCLVFELLSLNLFQFLQKNNFQGASIPLIRRIAVQLFMALKTVHSVGIIHCDLKPDNVLLKFENKSSIKVIDFGSACQEGNKVFEYIQSRFYRAPEIVIEAEYGNSIDVWSAGCIIYELLTGNPLFPANSEQELFKMYVEVMGMPPMDFILKGKRKHYYVEVSGKLRRHAEPGIHPINLLLENFDPKIVDLVDKCIKWAPDNRINAEEGLMHSWVRGGQKANTM